MKLKKGDKVQIVAGKDKGKEGVIDHVYTKMDKVLIQGVNIYKKHIRKNEKMPQGGVVDVPRPLDVAKVMLLCPHCKKPSRVGYKVEGTKKSRVCKNCHATL